MLYFEIAAEAQSTASCCISSDMSAFLMTAFLCSDILCLGWCLWNGMNDKRTMNKDLFVCFGSLFRFL